MDTNKRIFPILVGLGVMCFLGWYFFDVLVYIFFAILFSIMGTPIMGLLSKIKIKNRTLSTSASAFISLISLITLMSLALYYIIPAFVSQINALTSVNLDNFSTQFSVWFADFDRFLHEKNLLPVDKSLSAFFIEQGQNYLSTIKFSNIASNLFSFTGAVFLFVFSVIFLSYYSLKDQRIFFKMLENWLPSHFKGSYNNILAAIKTQVVRYFNAVILDDIARGAMVFLACWIFGIPNPLLHGVIAGILNTIPYVGTLISFAISILLLITAKLTTGATPDELTSALIIISVIYAVTKIIDTFLLQPYIFGKSVKAHPIEIFIVILCAGTVGGVIGMIFAVPGYSLIRILAHELFGAYFPDPNNEGKLEEETKVSNSE